MAIKYKRVTVGGRAYSVPPRIIRLDNGAATGWYLRHKGARLFSDSRHAGTLGALNAAILELRQRDGTLPERRLRAEPQKGKKAKLPAGVNGPVLRVRGKTKMAHFNVQIPLERGGFKITTVYIGTEKTYRANFGRALERAVALRKAGEVAVS